MVLPDTDRHTDTDRQTERHTDMKGQTEIRTQRHTHTYAHTHTHTHRGDLTKDLQIVKDSDPSQELKSIPVAGDKEFDKEVFNERLDTRNFSGTK